MKTPRTKSLVGLALTCLALAGASSTVFADVTVSTFDSDLSAFVSLGGTNLWAHGDSPTGITQVWTNALGGSMLVICDWDAVSGWQDRKCQADVGVAGALDLRQLGFLEFDAQVLAAQSGTNSAGGVPGIQIVGQGWTSEPDGGFGWTTIGQVNLSTNMAHYKVSLSTFPHYMSRLTLNFFQNPANTNMAIETQTLIDNVTFTAPPAPPPKMQYVNAIRGLNMWGTGGQYDRNSIETYQDGATARMWAQSGPASYSFTIGSYPTDPARTNLVIRMYLLPVAATESSPDWNETNCIMMDLTTDTNGVAQWYFRWKTNSANGNGQFYDAGRQIQLTDSNILGTWTLAFSDDTHVKMSGPGGASTNFVLGDPILTNVPDISQSFVDGSQGVVYLGNYSGDTNVGDLLTILTGAALTGGGQSFLSNNWLVDTALNSNEWLRVGAAPFFLVPTNNAKWLNWNIPDYGFELQTNTVNVGIHNDWSTNHGLPPADIYALHKAILIQPGQLPNTPKLYFRLSNPGY